MKNHAAAALGSRRVRRLRAIGVSPARQQALSVCGIAGVLHFDTRSADPRQVARMIAQVRHRGPDAAGVVVDGPVGLGHARLSILDLSGGSQPMRTADENLSVTFNGEIFNYIELHATLQEKGHRFVTQSDTEVILHAYEEYGDDCVGHFNGQWAFALWDRRRRRLFLSRDRLGVRPLFYTTAGGKLLFASEIKSLLVDGDVPRAIDPKGLDQLFTFWTTVPPATIFQGIHELPPGHNLSIEQGKLHAWPYWQLDYELDCEAESSPADERQCAEELLALLTDATRIRLRSDVPVGAYLSGGLDSSATTALIQRTSNAPLRTFSITFDDAEFDESKYQQELVAALQTDHSSIRCTHDDIARVFPEVIWHTEKPVLRTAPAPLFLLSQLVHGSGYKVVVTGEGADEMLGGYDIFKEAKLRRFWAAQPDSAFRGRLFERLYPWLPAMQAQPLAFRKAFFHVDPNDLEDPLFSHLPRWALTSRLETLLSADMRATIAGYDAYGDCRTSLPVRFAHWPHFCQAQYLEASILMPGYILSSQGDRVAMAHSVESRYPFLDHRLAEFAAKLPPRLKMKGLREKYLLKQAVGHLLPESIVRRTKQPYRAPDAQCFFDRNASSTTRDYIGELLSPKRIGDDGIFDPAAVRMLVKKARAGRAVGIRDNMALVGVLSTQLVVEQFIRNFQPQPEASHDGCDAQDRPMRNRVAAVPLADDFGVAHAGPPILSPTEE